MATLDFIGKYKESNSTYIIYMQQPEHFDLVTIEAYN